MIYVKPVIGVNTNIYSWQVGRA